MRHFNWSFKIKTTYIDGVTSESYYPNFKRVKQYLADVRSTEGEVSFKIFPYGGAIK